MPRDLVVRDHVADQHLNPSLILHNWPACWS